MNQKSAPRPRGLHQIALAALFTVGNTLLRFPWANAHTGAVVSFLLSGAVALGTVLAAYPLLRWLLHRRLSHFDAGVAAAGVLCLAVGAVALICAATATADLQAFLRESLLPARTEAAFTVLFLAVAALLACVPRRGMDILALLAFFCACIAVVILFLRGVPQFCPEYGAVEWPRMEQLGASVRPLLLEIALPMLPLSAYLALATPKKRGSGSMRPLAFGVLAGCGLMLLCLLQTVLTFGAPYAATLTYPYSRAVRVVSVGQYSFRPEILSYVLDYAACLLQVSVCLAFLRRALMRFAPRLGRFVPPLAAVGIFIYLYLR